MSNPHNKTEHSDIWSNPISSQAPQKTSHNKDFFQSDNFHLLLFLLTALSTYWVQGWWYAITIMGILGAHEMGHYVMSQKYGVVTTLPYFIPFPVSIFGTMGAVIKMKSPIPHRQALFDIGIAGPLAGLALAIPTILIGLRFSVVVPVYAMKSLGVINLGDPLLFRFLQWLALGKLPPGTDIILHPMAFAGWVGLFVTALNLLPIGQLDGGHIVYAIWGKQSKQIYLTAMGIMGLICIFYNPGWILLLALIAMFGFKHPPPTDDYQPLDKRRKFLGWITMVIFLLSFTPVPFKLRNTRPQIKQQLRWANNSVKSGKQYCTI
ncbi:MAG: site-2 protease family protein [bacterium]